MVSLDTLYFSLSCHLPLCGVVERQILSLPISSISPFSLDESRLGRDANALQGSAKVYRDRMIPLLMRRLHRPWPSYINSGRLSHDRSKIPCRVICVGGCRNVTIYRCGGACLLCVRSLCAFAMCLRYVLRYVLPYVIPYKSSPYPSLCSSPILFLCSVSPSTGQEKSGGVGSLVLRDLSVTVPGTRVPFGTEPTKR